MTGIWQLSLDRNDSYIDLYVNSAMENAELKSQIAQSKKDLYLAVFMIENSAKDMPFPYWIKSLSGEVLFVNRVYEDLVLSPMGFSAKDLIGNNGSNIFGEDAVKLFRLNDSMTIQLGRLNKFAEPVGIFSDGATYRYPIYYEGAVVLIGAIWLPNI